MSPCASSAAPHHQHVVADRLDVEHEVAGEQQAHPLVVREVAGQLEDLARPAGSMPLVGSSRITSFGSWTIAAAILSRCFMPVEYDSTRR